MGYDSFAEITGLSARIWNMLSWERASIPRNKGLKYDLELTYSGPCHTMTSDIGWGCHSRLRGAWRCLAEGWSVGVLLQEE
eukprot:scaffold93433_cov32-Tisochrysis_lutea.AAC.3